MLELIDDGFRNTQIKILWSTSNCLCWDTRQIWVVAGLRCTNAQKLKVIWGLLLLSSLLIICITMLAVTGCCSQSVRKRESATVHMHAKIFQQSHKLTIWPIIWDKYCCFTAILHFIPLTLVQMCNLLYTLWSYSINSLWLCSELQVPCTPMLD